MMNAIFYTIKSLKKHLHLLMYKAVCALLDCGIIEKISKENNILLYCAAKTGSVDAQYKLALLFRYGGSGCRNNELFEHWAYAAYEQGHIGAILELAKYYRLLASGGRRISGEFFIKYIDLAYEQFEIAAEAGEVEAQELLADMHRIGEGDGVPDWDGAIRWYNEAASNGSDSAQKMRDYLIESEGLSEWLPDSVKVDWFADNKQILAYE